MKFFLTLLGCLLLGGGTRAMAQTPAAPHAHSVSLNVEPVSTGGTSHDHENTNDKRAFEHPGSGHEEYRTYQTEVTKTSESFHVSVRNFGQVADTVQVEWYFVAAPVSSNGGSQPFVFDQGAKSVTIAPGATETFPVDSKEITSQLKRHNQVHKGKHGDFTSENSGKEKETGAVLDGWMMRVTADGRTLDTRASKDQWSDTVKDDAKLQAMARR